MQRARTVLSVMVMLIGALVAPQPAHAVILNFGVDVDASGNTVVPFFNGDNAGRWLNPGQEYDVSLNATSLLSGYTLNSAVLFVDAYSVGFFDTARVNVQGEKIGLLDGNWPAPIPVETGGIAYNWLDIDNTFFALTGTQLSSLATDTTYKVNVRNRSDSWTRVRWDGINIQIDATPNAQDDGGDHCNEPPVDTAHTPEPASMALFGMGMLGAGLARRKRK